MHHAPAEHLTFTIHGQRFGIRVDQIDEIIRAVGLTRLPDAPPIMEGLFDFRGTVVPVLDIRLRFRLPGKSIEPADHIVIARAGERIVGLRVDRALDVLTLAPNEIESIGAIAPASDYVAGVAKLPDGLLLIHDLLTFLSDAEAAALDDVVEEGLHA